ncbi:MAG: DUF503 domain-containing protein [Calditrichaeota bacterium]|nr:MAG: DUF503 domain-containing protein [Calditrichota bacterium]
MIVGILQVELLIPGSDSLKYKRMVVRSAVDRLRKKFNVSVAETDYNDKWQHAELGIAVVANNRSFADQVLQKAFQLLDGIPDMEIIEHRFEYL